MSSFKQNLSPTQVLTAGQMAGNLTTKPTNIFLKDNIGYQFNFTGTPTGTFGADVSLDYNQDGNGNVLNAGNWVPLSFTSASTATGAAGNGILDLNQLSAPWVRGTWVSGATGTQTVTTVADVAKSLASAYFLISDASATHKYAIWLKVSGTGVAPTVAGYTNEEVDIATNDSAATIATAIAAVINPLAGFDAAAVGAVITVTNTSAGPYALAVDGVTPTHFTFAYGTGSGSLNAFVVGKTV